MNKKWILILIVFSLASFTLAIPQTFNINGKLTDTTNSPLSGTYTFNFSIYSNSTGGTHLWTSNAMSVTTDSNGIYSVILNSINLNFSDQYYLGIQVESDAEMSPRLNLTSSPYAFRAQNVTVGGIIFDSNVDFGSRNLTTTGTGLFGFLGSLSSRITRLFVTDVEFSGNINGSGNITTLGRGNFTFTNSYAGNSNTPGLAVGNRTNGFIGIGSTGWYDDGTYFSPSGTRHFYIRSSVPTTYIYSPSILLGGTSGTTVNLRENTISGGNFSITPGSGNTYFARNAGNVGIGTSSPTGKLDVNGNINLSGDNGIITFSPTGSVGTVQSRLNLDLIAGYAGYQGATYSTIRFYTAGSADGKTERMRLTDVGNLGIGTTNATQKLDVRGNINASNEVYVRNGTAISPWLYNQTAVSGTGNLSGGGNAGYLAQWSGTSGLNNSVIYQNGTNVGIGTTNPSESLHILTDETGGGTSLFRLDNSGTAANEVGMEFWSSTLTGINSFRSGRIYGIYDSDDYTGARLTLQSMTTGNTLVDTLSLKSGNVGIGTTTPSNKLDVRGDINASGMIYYNNGTAVTSSGGNVSGGGTAGYIPQWTGTSTLNNSPIYTSGGKVGIGTGISPPSTLSILAENTIGTGLALYTSDYLLGESGAALGMFFGASTGETYSVINAYTLAGLGNLIFNSVGGNVGIGTTSPISALHVNGTAGGFTVDVAGTMPTLNTTMGKNITITSSGGSVIIQLG